MTKKKRVVLVILAVLVLLPAGLYLTRNQWAAFALKHSVATESNGQITITFRNVEVGIFSRTLAINEPQLSFKNVYFNKALGTTLKKAEFQRLVLINVSLWDVVWHRQFIIDNLLLEKPSFVLGMVKPKANPKAKPSSKKSRFDPAKFIEIMENHDIAYLRFAFLVRHTEINLGKIELNGKKGSDVYGGARYDFSIENMGTIHGAGDTLHPLTFDNLELTIRNFHRYSAPEKLNVSLDSAFYSTKGRLLFLRGLQVDLLDKDKNRPPKASFWLRWARISGLKSKGKKKKKKSLHLDEIKVVGGDLVLREAGPEKKKSSIPVLLKDLLASYPLLSLDTLDIRYFFVYQLDRKGDTLLAINRLNFGMDKLWADKQILAHPLENLHFKSLQTNFRQMAFGNRNTPVSVKTGRVSYDSHRKQVAVEGLRVRSRCKKDTLPASVFNAVKLVLGNFSIGGLQQRTPQLLSLRLVLPSVDLVKDTACARKGFLIPEVIKPLQLERLQVQNGRLRYREIPGTLFSLSGLNFFADSLPGTRLKGRHAHLHYDSLYFYAARSSLALSPKGEKMHTGELLWNQRRFKLKGLYYSRNDSLGSDSLQISYLTLVKPQLNPLLFHKTLLAGGVYIYKAGFSSRRQDTVKHNSVQQEKQWNHYVKLPFKARIGYVRIRKSSFLLASRNPEKDFELSSKVDLKLLGLKLGYGTSRLLSEPGHWEAVLKKTMVRQQNLTIRSEKVSLNSDSGSFFLKGVSLFTPDSGNLRYKIRVPSVSLYAVRFGTLFHNDSLIFGKAVVESPDVSLHFIDFVPDTLKKKMNRWHIVYDSLKFRNARFDIHLDNKGNSSRVQLDNLNLLYHPLMVHSPFADKAGQNLVRLWDFSLGKVVYFNFLSKLKVVADRVALQSASSRLHIRKITGTNFTPEMLDPDNRRVYSYFLVSDMTFSNLQLTAGKQRFLHIRQWSLPSAWVNIINNDNSNRKRSLDFLKSNFFSRYTRFLGGIHVDTSIFRNINVSYQYADMGKLVNIIQLDINTSDIQLGKPFLPGNTGDLFATMFINLNDRSVITGDSLYTFRMRDIRINLPQRNIRFDSITLTPRFGKADFFKRVGHQTDRITLYGKNAILNNFNQNDLVTGHFIHFGNLQLNNISVRFERDMHYPRNHAVKPMPLELIHSIPYKFKIDTMGLNNSMVSYFEYEVKSRNPGIFFIDHFNVQAQNVTNHLMPSDSNLILKFQGSGKLMKQSKLDFALVMPYFAPHQQWWFSADAGEIDLTQFNPLTENVLGLTVHSGMGSLHVPMITGDDKVSRGSVEFLYKKLKIRMYDRKKSEKSRKFWSPFANMIINGIVVKSNNPPFLGHVKKGVAYYERNPEKSFINYLWKSNLSGILSTIGINNKQQREVKRVEKKQTKASDKEQDKKAKDNGKQQEKK